MSLDYELLRVLHHKLRLKSDYESKIRRGPIKINLAKTTESNFETELATAKEVMTKGKMAADDKQLQLGEREAKIEKLKGRLNEAESNKEYQLLKDQIAADEQANSVLSDEILELLEKIDGFEADVAGSKENLAKSKSETQRITDQVEKELVVLKAELAEVLEAISGLEAKLPIDIKSDYQRRVKVHGEDALSFSDGSTCGNCNQTLSPQIKSQLSMQKPVFCGGCGSLMYITIKSPAGS